MLMNLGILPVLVIVGQGPIALAVGASGACLGIFFFSSIFFLFSFSLSERQSDVD